MSHDVLAPLEDAVETATRRLSELRSELREVRSERDRLARRVAELEAGPTEAPPHETSSAESDTTDERLETLQAERNEVRARLEKLLARMDEGGGDGE